MKVSWLCIGANKKRIIAGVLLAAVCCFAPFGLICPNYHEGIVFKLLYALGFIVPGVVSVKLSKKATYAVYPAAAVLTAVLTVFLSQMISIDALYPPSVKSLLLSSLCVLVVYSALYVITASARWSIVIGTAALLLLSLANKFVIEFQGNELTPNTLFGFRTAMNVLPNYKLEFGRRTIRALIAAAMICFGIFSFTSEKVKKPFRVRAVGLAVTALLGFALAPLTNKCTSKHWSYAGTLDNGYILNFTLLLKELHISAPDGYSADTINDLNKQYETTPPDPHGAAEYHCDNERVIFRPERIRHGA